MGVAYTCWIVISVVQSKPQQVFELVLYAKIKRPCSWFHTSQAERRSYKSFCFNTELSLSPLVPASLLLAADSSFLQLPGSQAD